MAGRALTLEWCGVCCLCVWWRDYLQEKERLWGADLSHTPTVLHVGEHHRTHREFSSHGGESDEVGTRWGAETAGEFE